MMKVVVLLFLKGLTLFFHLGGTFDDDAALEFYWSAASGVVDHYNVYLSVDGGRFYLVGMTDVLPTKEAPYRVPIIAEPVHIYRIRVRPVGAEKVAMGPASEASSPVLTIPTKANRET